MNIEMEQIVTACQRKESKAQKCLYEAFAPVMLGVCMRYTHSREEAQDLLHDGFIKVFDKISELRNPSAAGAWIYKIMVHESVTFISRKSEVVYCDLDEMDRNEAPELMFRERFDTDNYGVESVISALQQLPDRYRLVFNMREVEEMEYSEIAEELGQTENTVRCQMARARRMIKEMIDNNKV